MIVYCTEHFKSEYKKLVKYNSYKNLEREIIDNFFNGSDDQIRQGITLARDSYPKVIKKRLGGRSGYRVYFYIFVSDDKIYLGYIYPKTGPEGKDSLNRKFENMIVDEIEEAIYKNQLLELTVLNGTLDFHSS
jgi:hypothetical protein